MAKKKSFSRAPYPKTILVVKLSAMGDVLCLLPSIRELQRSLEHTQIDLLTTSRSNPTLFGSVPYIRRVLTLPAAPFSTLLFLLRNYQSLRKYDLILDYDQSYRLSELIAYLGRESAGFLTTLKGASFSLQIEYHVEKNEKENFFLYTEKVVTQFGGTVGQLTPEIPEILDGFQPSSELIDAIRSHITVQNPVVIIYPGSSKNAQFRRWPWSSYCSLSRSLINNGFNVVFAGGPDEAHLKPELSNLGYKISDWIDRWALLEWAWIFHNYPALLVGSDGGLFHLADLLGTPSISIFGPSSEKKWGSLNPKSTSISLSLECRPCIRGYLGEVPQKCWKGSQECLKSISEGQVYSHIVKFFDSTGEVDL
jgi:ADP-heptose:LPS heptosyltransferase